MAQIQDNQDTKTPKAAEAGRGNGTGPSSADRRDAGGNRKPAGADRQMTESDRQAARERKQRRKRREAALRRRSRQVRLRMILLCAVIAAAACVGVSALLIHRRNVKEQEAALASLRKTAEEQAAFEVTAEEAALADSRQKAEEAALEASRQKAEEAALAASRKKAEEADKEASRKKAEEAALAASKKAAEEKKEKEEAGKIQGLNESYDFKTTKETVGVPDDLDSEYAVLVDLKKGTVISGRDYETPINPASMTKVLTLLVAVENIDTSKLDTDTYEIHTGITDYVFTNQMSQVGFDIGDTPSIRSLLYGTILPSGADAALALAEYTAGSEEEFVALMNKKLKELGISDTAHFTNVVGAFDDDHYCSALDMATIMRAAIDNELCRDVLSCKYYEVPRSLDEDAEVIGISNWFLRRIEDKDTHGTVVGGKTGFTNEAGNCAVSYQVSDDGGHYICVTAQAPGGWPCIYDHVELYETFTN